MSKRLDFGDYHVGTYCGEHLFSLRDWRDNFKRYGLIRRMDDAFSIGPILFWKD
jgi:hypothetical protein